MKLRNLLLAATLGVSATAAQAVTIGNIEFDDNAFVDSVGAINGDFFAVGAEEATVEDVLTDLDPITYAASFGAGTIVLNFNGNVLVNGDGADLAIFEIGSRDTVGVSFGAAFRNYATVYSGTEVGGFTLNVARVDLSDFGFASGATVNSVTLDLGIETDGSRPAVSLVGGINVAPIPEPETYALMAMGLAAIGAARLRKRA